MNPRALAIVAFGEDDVAAYERVKRFYTRLGHAAERAYAERVGGRVGRPGEADVVTRLGSWEFQLGANTKNSAGEAAQLAKVGEGRIVQLSGALRPGHISGLEFLRKHGIADPYSAVVECGEVAAMLARVQQLTLDIGGA